MILTISDILSVGALEKERIILKATSAGELGEYAIFRTRKGDDGRPLSGDIATGFWFPDTKIQSGDLVVLYSKGGNDSVKKNAGGSNSHFFYWEESAPLWGTDDYVAVLVKAPSWQYFEMKKKK